VSKEIGEDSTLPVDEDAGLCSRRCFRNNEVPIQNNTSGKEKGKWKSRKQSEGICMNLASES